MKENSKEEVVQEALPITIGIIIVIKTMVVGVIINPKMIIITIHLI